MIKKEKPLLHVIMLFLVFAVTLNPLAFAAGEPLISADGAIVLDCQTGEIYFEKDADTPRHAASMTKIMSVYLVFDEIKSGRLSLGSPVYISSYAASVSNNPNYSGMENLKAGSSYDADTLLKLVMTASCNGSMIALAEKVAGTESEFVNRMNAKAASWGLNAHYADCTGFKDAGNAVSPRAQAEISKKAITDYPQILQYSSLKYTVFQGETFYTTNSLLRNDGFEGIDGLKTGTTTAAGYCFTGTASRNGRRVISVVMASKSSSERMSDSSKLLEYGFMKRAESESVWPNNTSNAKITFTVPSEGLVPNAENNINATVTGVGTGTVPCEVTWAFGGKSYMPKISTVSEGTVLTLKAVPPEGASNANIALIIKFPNGQTIRETGNMPIGGSLSFTGTLGVTSAVLYPGTLIRIPFSIKCNQNVSCTVPAGWYLDGNPIPGFQNPAFKCSPNGSSGYTLNTKLLSTGTHTVEFRLNPDMLPGIETASYTAIIEIVPPIDDLGMKTW